MRGLFADSAREATEGARRNCTSAKVAVRIRDARSADLMIGRSCVRSMLILLDILPLQSHHVS